MTEAVLSLGPKVQTALRQTIHLILEVQIKWEGEREIDREREARPYIVMVLGCAIDKAVEHALELAIVNMFDIFVSVLNGAK